MEGDVHAEGWLRILPAGGTYLTVYERLADGSVRMIRDTFNGLPGIAFVESLAGDRTRRVACDRQVE